YLSRSSFKLRFSIFSNTASDAKGLWLEALSISFRSSKSSEGLASTTVPAAMALGETKSRLLNGPVFATQAADPCRGELKLNSVWLTVWLATGPATLL